jgi:hypothetical protein
MPSMGAWCRAKRTSIGGPGNDIEARDPRDEGTDTVDSGNGTDECSDETVSNSEPQSMFAKDGFLRVVRTADDIAIQRRLIGREATR